MPDGERIAGWKVVRVTDEGPSWRVATVVRGSERARLLLFGPPDEPSRERLLTAARVLSVLVHPNVIRILGHTMHGDEVAVTTEPPPSADLARWIETGPHDLGETLRLFRGIIEGLGALHEVSHVHRMLEPARIKLGRSPMGRLTPKLDDLLLGELAASDATPTTDPMGIPRYVAPEAFQGAEASENADLFAAGCVLYEMLTGQPAFDGDDLIAVYDAIANARYVPPVRRRSDLPDVVSDLVDDLLQPDPDRRPADTGEVLQRLGSGEFAGWISRATALPSDPTELPPLEGVSTDPRPLIDEQDTDTGPTFDPNALPELVPEVPPPPASLVGVAAPTRDEIEAAGPPSADLKAQPLDGAPPPEFDDYDPWDPLSEDAPRPRLVKQGRSTPGRRKRRSGSSPLTSKRMLVTWAVVLAALAAAFFLAVIVVAIIIF